MMTYGNTTIKDGQMYSVCDVKGLSTDTKPTDVGNGSTFLEMDTGAVFFFDAENGQWLEF